MKIEQKAAYLSTPNNIKLSNGVVELGITTDYGKRIMRYAIADSKDDDNVFATIPPINLPCTLSMGTGLSEADTGFGTRQKPFLALTKPITILSRSSLKAAQSS